MDPAEPRQDEKGRFVPGNNGGPGRPKGARNKLGEAFIEALHESFQRRGAAAIEAVINEKPDQYLKVIASLMPKDVNLNLNDHGEMSDDELIRRIRELDATIAPFLARGESGTGGDSAGTVGTDIASRVH